MSVSTLDQIISRAVYLYGVFEEAELSFIRQVVKQGMTVFDVGANIGVHTLTLADCVGSYGAVHAFEPSSAFERLAANIALNHFQAHVHANRCAVGSTDGNLRLMACRPGLEAFTSRGTPLKREFASGASLNVAMTSLDSYANQNHIERVDFLKLDVEGSEPEVLRGARSLIAAGAIRLLMTEVNEVCLANCGSSPAELVDHLRHSGFLLRGVDPQGSLTECPDTPQGTMTVVGWYQR